MQGGRAGHSYSFSRGCFRKTLGRGVSAPPARSACCYPEIALPTVVVLRGDIKIFVITEHLVCGLREPHFCPLKILCATLRRGETVFKFFTCTRSARARAEPSALAASPSGCARSRRVSHAEVHEPRVFASRATRRAIAVVGSGYRTHRRFDPPSARIEETARSRREGGSRPTRCAPPRTFGRP